MSTGSQFNFIKLKPNLTPIGTNYFFGSKRFYLWLSLPLCLIPLAILFGKRRKAIASDVAGNKLRRANKLARKYLSKAKKELGDDFDIRDFHDIVLKNGAVALPILEELVDAYIARRKAS